jgi:hypothetical protein
VILARPCSRSYMGWNLQNYDDSNDPASCNSVSSDGGVPGGFSHPVWPSTDHDVNTTVSFCVDNSSNPPVYRECIATISMWMAYGVCEKNLYPSRTINDLSSIPIDEIPDVIADFTNQIKILRGGDISVHLSGKYMYLPAIIEHEKAHIANEDNIIIEQALTLNNEIESQPIPAQLAEELGSDESVRKQYAATAMYRLQLKAQPLITETYGVSDEQDARSVQAIALQDAINRLESRLKNKK